MKALLTTVLAALCLAAGAQTKVYDGRQPRSLEPVDTFYAPHYWNDLYNSAAHEYAFRGTTKADFERWQPAARAKLKEILGITKIEKQLAGYRPKAVRVDSEDVGYAIRERWQLWTEPDVPLPFVLLRPKGVKGRVPLMITPHGHGWNTESYAGVYTSEKDSLETIETDKDIAVQAVRHGFLAIAPTTRGFGKTNSPQAIAAKERSMCRELLLHDLLVGRTPIGDRVWDISRIIDWALASLPVAADKIIVSGNSGGGTVTLFAGAIDTRIAFSLPSSYFNNFRDCIGTFRHCECNYIPGALDFGDVWDIAGLTAPRQFVALQGVLDKGFPIAGADESFAHLKKIYAAAGVPERCCLERCEAGHRYYKRQAWSHILKWLGL